MPPTVHAFIIDDSPDDREAIRRALRHEATFRYRITEFESGEAALEAIARGEMPDLAICDFCLPGIDGLEVVRRLRKGEQLPPFPIVLLTGSFAHHQAVAVEEALTEGVQDFFDKRAIAPGLLPRVARNAMDRYRLIRRLVASENEARSARLRAEDASRAKSMFLASMSHELRTPLTAVLGLTELLLENPDSPDARQMLEMVRANGQHLAELLNDLLDLARIEAGGLEIDVADCDPRKLIEDLCSLIRFRANDHGLSLDVRFDGDLPRRVRTDAVRLRQILMNLLSNAIKFTRQGGIAVCASTAEADEEPMLRIVVEDSGIGIDDEQLARIFEPFVQVSRNDRRAAGGVGLGLAISRALAQALGGDLSATSAPGSGSRFELTISAGVAEAEHAVRVDGVSESPFLRQHAFDGSSDSWQDKRILVAEDTPANRFLIRRLLQPTDAELVFVEDGQQAVEKVLEETGGRRFDLVLMDMQMPGKDGFEATAELRRSGFAEPIVALTAAAMEGDRERCLRAGCSDYVMKPIDREALLATLAEHLGIGQVEKRA
ncbi:MAG TPA: response regulator [Pirellulaceae bacterium]|jgi:signal transduction histidine kinase|nr:response regulator [Pirellulaceae bacterium]